VSQDIRVPGLAAAYFARSVKRKGLSTARHNGCQDREHRRRPYRDRECEFFTGEMAKDLVSALEVGQRSEALDHCFRKKPNAE
jgi:hypothetical protein